MTDDSIPSHGGQLRELAERFQIPEEALLDFSASISPIPPSDTLVEALCERLRNRKILTQYPDTKYRELKDAIARSAGVSADSACIGNGVMSLLAAAAHALHIRRCLVLIPAFSEYARTLEACGVVCDTLLLCEERNFQVDVSAVLTALTSTRADALLLANPHSPSGCLMPAPSLTALQQSVAALGVTMIVEEAFMDYLPEMSLSPVVANTERLIVLRSLTKFFAIPGLRVAYPIAQPELRNLIEAMLPQWPVDSIAAMAAQLCLGDTALAQRTREINALERNWLTERIEALGLKVFPASANHLLIRLPDDMDGSDLWRRLIIEYRIVIRSCATFEGLTARHLRIAVRSRPDNQMLRGVRQAVTIDHYGFP